MNSDTSAPSDLSRRGFLTASTLALGAAENTVKKHLQNIFEKLGIESRNAATVRALETLSGPRGK